MLAAEKVIKQDFGVKQKLQYSCIMVAHFVCLLFTGFITYISRPGTSLFSWHPTLMVFAFSLCMVQAVLVFSPISSIIQKSDRKTKVQYHWLGMVAALLCALGGVAVIWYNKELAGKSHMTSWHGTLGYITVGYVCVQCIAGITVKYPNLVKSIVPRPADLKLYHATSGLLLFTLAYVTIVLGMWSNFFTEAVTGTSWYACVACPAVLVLVVMTQITQAYVGRAAVRKPVTKK